MEKASEEIMQMRPRVTSWNFILISPPGVVADRWSRRLFQPIISATAGSNGGRKSPPPLPPPPPPRSHHDPHPGGGGGREGEGGREGGREGGGRANLGRFIQDSCHEVAAAVALLSPLISPCGMLPVKQKKDANAPSSA